MPSPLPSSTSSNKSHPLPFGPLASVILSAQHPYSKIEQFEQPSKPLPIANVILSGQQPNVLLLQS